MTIREVLAEGGAALTAAGIENSGLDASLFLAEVLNMSRSSLIAAGPEPVSGESLSVFREFIKRRLDGECAAYILGRKEFYGLEFLVNPAVLVPRPETETLVEAALGKAPILMRVLDLCTGSGAVAIALKHTMPELTVWATDISANAIEVAKANAKRLLPPESIYFCQGDLFEALLNRRSEIGDQGSGVDVRPQFSLIVSNPPYVPAAEIAGLSPEVRGEPLAALDGGSDGLDIIKRIICKAPDFLCPGGILLLEADPRQMLCIIAFLKKAGFADIQTHRDLSGRERVIGGRKPDSTTSPCFYVIPPR